jgi:hypothetical protein
MGFRIQGKENAVTLEIYKAKRYSASKPVSQARIKELIDRCALASE